MTRWCLECGALSLPVVAVGVNEDGDPACVAHIRKSKQMSQPEKSVVMSENRAGHKCPGFEKSCETIIGPNKELCTRCYARRHYRQSHGGAARVAKIAPKRETPKVANSLAALKADLQAKLAAIELIESLL